jgi:hypothetical protein
MHDLLSQAGLRCYEVFRDGAVAFEREGQLCFGPASKLSAFLSGSNESFLVGEEAQDKIAKLHSQQRPTRSQTSRASENDGLAQTRNRWEAERAKGQWSAEFVQGLIAKIRSSDSTRPQGAETATPTSLKPS